MNSYTHTPVLLTEVLEALQPRTGGRYVDATVGGAGHAVALLEASGATGWLLGVDRDGAALKAAAERLAPYAGRFELRQGTFDRLAEWLPPASCDGVLMDLGVSSPQLDHPERGFSFQADGPLDMRMDASQERTAAEVVNTWPQDALARVFFELGDEPKARRLAREIEEARKVQPLTTTRQLAALVEKVSPRRGSRLHPATRVFQALRMVVNDELNLLRRGMEAACQVLRGGGRLAILSFQSLEARLVKQFGDERSRGYDYEGPVDDPALRRPKVTELRWVIRRPVVASEQERNENPRSRSAQLRVLEKRIHAA